MNYSLVIVGWEDITSNHEPWLYIDDAMDLETAKMTTVGWLVKDRDDSIVIVSSLGDKKEVGDVNCIPKSVINSMRIIEES